MTKFLKNLKITKIILLLIVISITFSSIIGFVGYYNMKKINNNVSDMYSDNLTTLSNISAMKSNFIKIKVLINQAQIKYNDDYYKQMEECDKIIMDNYNHYTSTPCDKEETKYLKDLETDYSNYTELVTTFNDKLKNGTKLSDTEYEALSKLGEKIESTLIALEDYDLAQAKDTNDEANSTYLSSNKKLLFALIMCILILGLISYFIMKLINKSLKEMINIFDKVSKGDLSLEIHNFSNNEFGIMKKSLNHTIENISNMIRTVKEKSYTLNESSEKLSSLSEEMSSSTDNVSIAIQDVAKGTSQQAEDLVDTTSVLDCFASSLNEMIKSIEDIHSFSNTIESNAKDSNEKIVVLIPCITEISQNFNNFGMKISNLEKHINEVNEITSLINSIAEQTNLLALNAAIESARAGEYGKGFAVVADEIRKLAEQSKISSENIRDLINSISSETQNIVYSTNEMNSSLNDSVNTINYSIDSFKEIINSVNKLIPEINRINNSALKIYKEKDAILEKVESMSSVSEEVSASSEEIAAACEEVNSATTEVSSTAQLLNNMTDDMITSVNKFTLKQN